jgi:hypothetical protein
MHVTSHVLPIDLINGQRIQGLVLLPSHGALRFGLVWSIQGVADCRWQSRPPRFPILDNIYTMLIKYRIYRININHATVLFYSLAESGPLARLPSLMHDRPAVP